MDEFNLSEMTDAYKEEFAAASEWFRLSFHSYQEFPDYPYVNSSYEDIYKLFNMIKNEIFRFVGEKTGLKFKKPDDNLDPNLFTNEELKAELQRRSGDELICIGNHEQYFFKDYFAYQSEYEEKIYTMAKTLHES